MSAGAGSSRQRFSRHQRARRWVLLRRLLLVTASVGLVGASVWLVFFSSVLAVARVEVEGARNVQTDEVVAAADVPMGRPLARVGVDAVEARVENALAEVADAEVRRAWPRTVTIAVRERTPAAVVSRHAQWWLVDAEGVQFRQVERAPRELPVVHAEPAATEEAAAVVAGLPRALLRRVTTVEADTVDSITLQLRNGTEVVWGSVDDSARKAEVLAALLDNRRRLEGQVYDVSVPGSPTVATG